jgi:NADPH:quinone reductase
VFTVCGETLSRRATSPLVAPSATNSRTEISDGVKLSHPLASQILAGMEQAAVATAAAPDRNGSARYKQVYIYGGLDSSATTLTRNFGTAWGVGGWLLFDFLRSTGPEIISRLRSRVAAEITTTFASTYTREVSLSGMLHPDAFNNYVKHATGEKFLLTPQAP